jgi:hypothetical protein
VLEKGEPFTVSSKLKTHLAEQVGHRSLIL